MNIAQTIEHHKFCMDSQSSEVPKFTIGLGEHLLILKTARIRKVKIKELLVKIDYILTDPMALGVNFSPSVLEDIDQARQLCEVSMCLWRLDKSRTNQYLPMIASNLYLSRRKLQLSYEQLLAQVNPQGKSI